MKKSQINDAMKDLGIAFEDWDSTTPPEHPGLGAAKLRTWIDPTNLYKSGLAGKKKGSGTQKENSSRGRSGAGSSDSRGAAGGDISATSQEHDELSPEETEFRERTQVLLRELCEKLSEL